MSSHLARAVLSAVLLSLSFSCQSGVPEEVPAPGRCIEVQGGFGNAGSTRVKAEVVATQLEVPWGLAWLPGGDLLVTERPGRVRRIRAGTVFTTPVATVQVSSEAESGLLGLALSPQFDSNRRMFLYATVGEGEQRRNEVQRWILSEDFNTATFEKVIFGDIPAAQNHDGGRLRFGPEDGLLYVGTGDAREPDASQNLDTPAGKILRITEDGAPAPGNPFEGKPVFMYGLRNTQGFDWFPSDRSLLAVTDHGPSGELSRRAHDEVNVGRAGDNFGWPGIYSCESEDQQVTPSLTWDLAVPPGGAAFYTSDHIGAWKGSLLVATLSSRHLHRVVFDGADPRHVTSHEVYLENQHGRLREATMGPDGHLYVTTSNCDGRGDCPPDKDMILRIVPDAG